MVSAEQAATPRHHITICLSAVPAEFLAEVDGLAADLVAVVEGKDAAELEVVGDAVRIDAGAVPLADGL